MKTSVVDIHNHPNWRGVNVRRLVTNMDEHGIARTWLLSWEIPLQEYEVEPAYFGRMDSRGVAAPLWTAFRTACFSDATPWTDD